MGWRGDGVTWGDDLNWSDNTEPGINDDAVIDSNVTVNLTADTIVNSVTLGNVSGTTSPTLNFDYDALSGNGFILTHGDLVVHPAATVTHTAGTTVVVGSILIDVQSGGAVIEGDINLNAKGYQQAAGPGAGGGAGNGGGYGGEGGGIDYGYPTLPDGYPCGPTYGSLTQPVDLGSGGGYSNAAGDGGGAVQLLVNGTVEINGSITAVGGNGGVSLGAGGGGSGGSVYLVSGSLQGTGSINVDGGNGAEAALGTSSGGGGGRIAFYTDDDFDEETTGLEITAYGGNEYWSTLANNRGEYGGAGTIYIHNASSVYGDLIIDNGDQLPTRTDAWVGRTPLGTHTFDTLIIRNYGNLYLVPTADITYTTLDWSNQGIITDEGGTFALLADGVDLMIPETAILVENEVKTFNSLIVNGTLTHQGNATQETRSLEIEVTGDLTVGDTGEINVDYKGYRADYGPEAPTGNSGAGYGGEGGQGGAGVPGGTYGSYPFPVNLGSGGGCQSGIAGEGGGEIKITVGGVLYVYGEISADGGSGVNYASNGHGGGSGGSVYLIASVLAGDGIISALGGNGSCQLSPGGGGGGGRIAYHVGENLSTVTFDVDPGSAGCGIAENGVLGTIFPNTYPAVTAPGNIAQYTDGSGYLLFQVTALDTDLDDTKLKVEYSDDNGASWYDPVLVSATPSAGTVDLDNGQTYQIGSSDAIDTSGGSVVMTVVWDTQSALNGGGSLDDIDQHDIQVRVTPNDGYMDGATRTSVSFEVDNLDPANVGGLDDVGGTESSAVLEWLVAVEANFNHYEVWYGEVQADVESRGGTASEWDDGDDSNLSSRVTTGTEVTSLTVETLYYFRMWAVDDFGNQASTATISHYVSHPPVVTVPNNITQATDGSGHVSFDVTVSDIDSDDTRVRFEYSDDGGASWYDPYLIGLSASRGSADLTNAQAYQVGSLDEVDTSGGPVTLSVVWDTQSSANGPFSTGGGSLDDTDQLDIRLRAVAHDGWAPGGYATSGNFEVDNLDPADLADFEVTGWKFNNLSLGWHEATERNFNHYEIWYGTDRNAVIARSGGASEWDNGDDAGLSSISMTATTITGLNPLTKYYLRIWAVDDFGNEMGYPDVEDDVEEGRTQPPPSDDEEDSNRDPDEGEDGSGDGSDGDGGGGDDGGGRGGDGGSGSDERGFIGDVIETIGELIVGGTDLIDDIVESSAGVVVEWVGQRVKDLIVIIGGEEAVEYIEDCSEDTIRTLRLLSWSPFLVGLVTLFALLQVNIADLQYLVSDMLANIGAFFGVMPKRQPWGVVYNSVTKEPLARAVVRLYQGEELIQTVVSDMNGVFSYAPKESGIYRLEVRRQGFEFPSEIVLGSSDGHRAHVYRGEDLRVKEDQEINVNVPMDPEDLGNIQRAWSTFLHIVLGVMGLLTPALLIFGIGFSALAYSVWERSIYMWLALFDVLLLIYHMKQRAGGRTRWGTVVNDEGYPVSNLEVGLYDRVYGKLVDSRYTDEGGRYRFVVPGGEYYVRPVEARWVLGEGDPRVGVEVGSDVEKDIVISNTLRVREVE